MPQLIRIVKIVVALVGGFIVLAFIALAGAVLIIEPDTYRPAVQRHLSAALGREITMGRLEIGKSLFPTVALTDLQVANPVWASRPNLLSVSSASARLDLVALVKGQLEIGRIELQGVDLLLERDRNGVGNWKFASSEPKASRSGTPPLPGLDEVAIRNAQIGWRGEDGTVTAVRLESGNAMLPADKPVRIEVRVAYRQVPIDANLTASTSLGDALSGQPVSASVALRVLDARVNFEITAPGFDVRNMSINFAANGQQLDSMSALLGQQMPAVGPYRVSGRAQFATGMMQLDNLRMSIDGLTGKTPLNLSRIEIDAGEVTLGRKVATTAQLAGRLDQRSFRLNVTSAAVNQLENLTDAIPVNTTVMLDDLELGAKGAIRWKDDSWGFELLTNVTGDVSALARLTGTRSFKQPLPVDLSGQIAGDTSEIAATRLNGSIAQTTISGDITIRPTTPLQLNGALDIGSVDLAAFEMIGNDADRALETRSQSGPPDWIDSVDADLRFRIEQIIGSPLAATGISGHGTVKAGRLEISKFRGTLAGTPVLADAGLQWKNNHPHVAASITIPVVNVTNLNSNDASASSKRRDKSGLEQQRMNAPLPLAPLRLIDADLTLNIGEIRGAPIPIDRLNGSVQLSRGRLSVPSLSFDVAGASAQSTLMLDASRDDAQLSANVSAARVDIATLGAELNWDAPVVGTVGQVTVTLDTRGGSLPSWIENAKVAARVGASTLKQIEGEQQLTVQRARAFAGPGVDVRAELHGQFGDFPVNLVVTGGRLAELLDDKPLWPKVTATLRTKYREDSINLFARTALHAVLSGRDVPVNAEMRSAIGNAVVTGTIADLREPARTPLDVIVSAKARSFQHLFDDEWALPDVLLKAGAKASIDNRVVSLQRLGIRAGKAELSGDIRLELKDRVKLTASLAGEAIDLRPWIPAPVKPARAASTENKQLPAAAKLDRPFNLKALREIDAVIDLKARRLISHRLDLDNFALRADLDSGRLVALMSIAEGDSSVELQFDGSRDVSLVTARARMTNLDLDALKASETQFVPLDVPRFTAQLKFAGVGMTPRQVYKTAKGEVLTSIGPGQLIRGSKPFMVQAVSSDLIEALLPGRKPSDYTQLECAAVHFKVENGVASSPDGMAARFKEVDILGSGAINLETREILFGFTVERRRWFSFSFLDIAGDFARVGGTLDNPTVGLDPGGTLFTGGAAWATAGVSLLATRFWRKLGSADNPCEVIIESGRRKSKRLDSLIKDLPKTGELIKKLPLPGSKKNTQ